MNAEAAAIARDPLWLPHRHDPGHDAIHFLRLERAEHRAVMFLTDEYLPASAPRLVIRRSETLAGIEQPAPLHFIFHSAYCCSTLLARAFDHEGVSMGLKEPVILNDMVGWRRRGAEPRQLGDVMDSVLSLIARPFSPGEAVIVKPSNVLNPLAAGVLALRPASNALLLHAPLPTYLGSVAKKGMAGRLWVRELLVNLLEEGVVDLGFGPKDYLGQTDLQCAAAGWLAQHMLFARIVERFGPERVRTLDSAALTARPAETMAGLAQLFGLALDAAAVEAIVAGPAFTRHSKFGERFGSKERAAEHADAAIVHAEEIDRVMKWAEAVAANVGLSLKLDAPLLG